MNMEGNNMKNKIKTAGSVKTMKEFRAEIIELIKEIEEDEGKGTLIEIETLMDNTFTPGANWHDEIKPFENAVHLLAEEGFLKIVDNSGVQTVG